MSKRTRNPFITSGPVPVDRFVNRDQAIRAILSRIVDGQNTAVVGGPKSGKSSLLQYLAGSESCGEQLGAQFTQTAMAFLDCHLGPDGCTPADFWQETLACIWADCNDVLIRRILKRLETDGLRKRDLDQLFRTATRNDWRIVLLIDVMDSMLQDPEFNNASFLGALHSLSNRFQGLSLVTSSRLSIADMNHLSQKLNAQGARFFDRFVEIELGPFAQPDVDILLDIALADTGMTFDRHDRDVLRSLAGGHPFLLQAAAGALYDAAIVTRDTDKARYSAAIDAFYRATRGHFGELWQHLSSRERFILAALCLGELQGRITGQTFALAGIARRDHDDATLGSLSDRGLVELIDQNGWHDNWRNWVVWDGQPWHVTSRGWMWWTIEQIVLQDEVDWQNWLGAGQDESILGQKELDTLRAWSANLPKSAIDTAVKIGELLLQEWLATM